MKAMNFDQWISFYANQIGELSPAINSSVVFFAEYFPYLVVVGFLYFVLKHRLAFYGRYMLIMEGIGAGIVARAIVEGIRFFIHRPRPYLDNSAIVALINETSYSFPSGHAVFFFALSTTVYIYNKRWGIWFFVASTVIGLARVIAGVHYISDILSGVALGVFVAWIMHRIFIKKEESENSTV